MEASAVAESSLLDSEYWQLLTMVRAQWPGFLDEECLRDGWINRPEHNPVHFMYYLDNLVAAHVSVLCRDFWHDDKSYRLYGLGHVYTFPDFRGRGYATRLVSAATDYIRSCAADIGLLTCAARLCPLYEQAGWRRADGVTLYAGKAGAVVPIHETVMLWCPEANSEVLLSMNRSGPVRFGGPVW
jgi:GNAT superfamily N-acetyltransferase